MNFKRTFLLLLPLLAFLGIGTMLSNVESSYADELLEAHGLTNDTRYFRINSDEKISSLLKYLDKKYAHHQIQLHLDNNYEKSRYLFGQITPQPACLLKAGAILHLMILRGKFLLLSLAQRRSLTY